MGEIEGAAFRYSSGCSISAADLALLNSGQRAVRAEDVFRAQVEFYDRIDRKRIADGMSFSGTLARLRSEGRSEDYIAGYVEGRR